MEPGAERKEIKIRVQDKRTTKKTAPIEAVEPSEEVEKQAEVVEEAAAEVVAEAHDYLDDLRRLQAEFDNYRKRVLREQSLAGTRATTRLVEKLLPVLDNFERAIEHGADDAGVELILKDLKRILEDEGLQEIAAEGRPFDPQVHEAVESVEDPDVEEPVVKSVYRKGYRLGNNVLRAAMVAVARPTESDSVSSQSRAAQG